jgi:hypothetical protein
MDYRHMTLGESFCGLRSAFVFLKPIWRFIPAAGDDRLKFLSGSTFSGPLHPDIIEIEHKIRLLIDPSKSRVMHAFRPELGGRNEPVLRELLPNESIADADVMDVFRLIVALMASEIRYV